MHRESTRGVRRADIRQIEKHDDAHSLFVSTFGDELEAPIRLKPTEINESIRSNSQMSSNRGSSNVAVIAPKC